MKRIRFHASVNSLIILCVVWGSISCFSINSSMAEDTPIIEKNLVFGMSTALSGPVADLGKNMKLGVLAGFHRANRAGGVQGQHLRLITLDDGYEPTQTAPNMRQLIGKEHVLAIVGNVGTPTAITAIPIAIEQKTLFFAPYTGAGILRKTPPDRYVINYRASYAEETGAMINALMTHAQLKANEIAFFTQRDGYGDAGFAGGITALKQRGLTDSSSVLHVRYDRNTLAVEDAVARILMADSLPKAIILVGTYPPCAKFIQLAKDSGIDALFLNVSFVGSTPLAQELGPTIDKVIVTQVVPHPIQSTLPIVREYQADLKTVDSSAKPSHGSLEGYVAARILVKALHTIQGTITRENLVQALQNLGHFDMGLKTPLHLSLKEHQASHRLWPSLLKAGHFIPFSWSDLRTVSQ